MARVSAIAVKLRKAYALTGLIFNALTFTQGFALCFLLLPLQGINLHGFFSPERALALAQGIALGCQVKDQTQAL